MPSLVCTSRIKAVDDHTTVVLFSKHCLLQGNPSDTVYTVKQACIPDNVDILLASNLTFTISGLLDRKKVSADCVQRSHLARHIVEYLKTVRHPNRIDFVTVLTFSECGSAWAQHHFRRAPGRRR